MMVDVDALRTIGTGRLCERQQTVGRRGRSQSERRQKAADDISSIEISHEVPCDRNYLPRKSVSVYPPGTTTTLYRRIFFARTGSFVRHHKATVLPCAEFEIVRRMAGLVRVQVRDEYLR